MQTKRKPFKKELTASWWQKNPFFRFYMLREGTAVFTLWFSLVLIYGVFCLGQGVEAWAGFIGFLKKPFILVLNIISLLAALLHTKTWFELAPKAKMIIVRGQKLPDIIPVSILWGATLAVSIILLFLIFK
ncbi:fumarate reductase subunit FrdC [Neisseria sp. Ec49-e6-T10]|uniref:fumarate reductase subunit FrdC n=1 Tax=Neisseria sp. Ec49-e6-T10 TaxID=3140744 RepID=UPI003EB71620